MASRYGHDIDHTPYYKLKNRGYLRFNAYNGTFTVMKDYIDMDGITMCNDSACKWIHAFREIRQHKDLINAKIVIENKGQHQIYLIRLTDKSIWLFGKKKNKVNAIQMEQSEDLDEVEQFIYLNILK